MLTVVAAERPQSANEVLHALGVSTGGDRELDLGPAGAARGVDDTGPGAQVRPQEEYKLLFCGSQGAGKTTAIGELGDLNALGTELHPGALGGTVKKASTVAMDYAYMDLGVNERAHLYGLPGGAPFAFLGNVLSAGAFGVVVLIDNRQHDAFAQLDSWLTRYADLLGQNRVVVGVTHMDVLKQPSISEYQQWLIDYCKNRAVVPAVFDVDARSARDLKMLLQALFYAGASVAESA
jgi:signal recognition particle receptor subunit beta